MILRRCVGDDTVRSSASATLRVLPRTDILREGEDDMRGNHRVTEPLEYRPLAVPARRRGIKTLWRICYCVAKRE